MQKRIAMVGCMDSRLNLFFEELRDSLIEKNPGAPVYIIRDAGGGINAVEKTLLGLGVNEIHDYTHTNCGAMKVALSACAKIRSGSKLDEVESSRDVYKSIIAPLANETYQTPLEIEWRHTMLQSEALSHLMTAHPEFETSCELIDINKINVPKSEKEHMLIIGMAYDGKYTDITKKWNLELQGTYFVQADYIEEVKPAVRLAVERLNIHNAMFVSNAESEHSIVDKWSNDSEFRQMFEKHLMKVPVISQKEKHMKPK